MSLHELDGVRPDVAPSAWIADTARVVGRVTIAAEASLWFGCSLRGDIEPIVVGARSNVQDNAVLHTEIGCPLTIGAGVTVGHLATLHGCTIGDDSLVGISAVVLNGARIGRHCLVGAHALVTEGKEFPDGSLILGSPAKLVRPLTEAEIEGIRENARRYVANAALYRRGLVPLR
jgi:carbonic anhydrase/acetyltransferase-like protein (isoleucine patch superfamily)